MQNLVKPDWKRLNPTKSRIESHNHDQSGLKYSNEPLTTMIPPAMVRIVGSI